MPKFDCIQNHIVRFLREYRISGVERRKCSAEIHIMKMGEDTYVYDGASNGLKSVFCSDLECFLKNLDKSSVTQYMKSIPKNSKK